MRHPRVIAFERKLKRVFDRVDRRLEEKFGDRYPLHPSRAEEGETCSPAHDGLFQVGASFSAGYGTQRGRGYVLEVRMVTLERVRKEDRSMIEEEALAILRKELPRAFPGRELELAKDGPVYKVTGDLGLGSV